MNSQTFETLLDYRLKMAKKILGEKAKQYASEEDRLQQFKAAARIMGNTQAQALWGMAMKHLVSVQDLVAGRLKPTPNLVDEKIGDMINYLILLDAIFTEESQNEINSSLDSKK